jgi:FixJ family two-component response regulator
MPTPRKTIAIVEDDASVRKALERQLCAAGYRCATFESAEEFLLVARILKPACLLADIHLGGMTGLELAVHPTVIGLELPVVLISGSNDPQIEGPAREIGSAFLRKPIPSQILLDAIVDNAGPPYADGEL